MTKKELRKKIAKLVGEVNTDIEALEREKYTDASYIYERLRQNRFDRVPYLTKSGKFRSTSALSKAAMMNEYYELQRWMKSNTRNPKLIKEGNEKRYQSFNKYLQEHGKKTIYRKTYAKIRKAFADFENQKVGYITSDAIIEIAKMNSDKEMERLMDFLNSHSQEENENYLIKKYKVKVNNANK